MDYLQIYNEQFDNVSIEIKEKILRDLKQTKSDNKNLERQIRNIPEYLGLQETEIIDEFKNDDLWGAFGIFYNRHDYCGKNLNEAEVIQMILNQEVQIEYEKSNINEYPLYIKKIAEIQSIRIFKKHFEEFATYYTKVWEQTESDLYFEEKFIIENYEVSKEYFNKVESECRLPPIRTV